LRLASPSDAKLVNKWIERDSGREVDFTDFLANPMNAVLIEGDGGALFVWRAPGIYEVHVFFEQRGREVIAISRTMLDYMKTEFGARWFWAAVPVESRHVIMFSRLMGWKSRGKANFPHGLCEVFSSENG
jgi:hypothetical protein